MVENLSVFLLFIMAFPCVCALIYGILELFEKDEDK